MRCGLMLLATGIVMMCVPVNIYAQRIGHRIAEFRAPRSSDDFDRFRYTCPKVTGRPLPGRWAVFGEEVFKHNPALRPHEPLVALFEDSRINIEPRRVVEITPTFVGSRAHFYQVYALDGRRVQAAVQKVHRPETAARPPGSAGWR